MEQVGWDGKPRPANLSAEGRQQELAASRVPAQSDTFLGEPFLGPLG